MAFGKIKNLFESDDTTEVREDEYYSNPSKAVEKGEVKNKMIIVEPRAYSESQQIADHLKNRNSVVVNFKRVTSDQSKRIIDFLSGTIYAIRGEMQKIGNGIYLCTPNDVSVQGKITEEEAKANKADDDVVEW